MKYRRWSYINEYGLTTKACLICLPPKPTEVVYLSYRLAFVYYSLGPHDWWRQWWQWKRTKTIHPSIYPCIYPSIYLPITLNVHLSVRPNDRLSVWLVRGAQKYEYNTQQKQPLERLMIHRGLRSSGQNVIKSNKMEL